MSVEAQRFDEDEAALRKTSIIRDGQPARLSVAWLDDLLILAIEPRAGFIHLVRNVQECLREYGPYHISICQRDVVSDKDLEQIRSIFHEVECILPISCVRSEGFMEIHDSFFARHGIVRRLHDQPAAWYRSRSLHVSG
jgi:hypothetical protein